ncbi:hypothetical protein DSUL_160007 [Desulfovibrionales bacterium]
MPVCKQGELIFEAVFDLKDMLFMNQLLIQLGNLNAWPPVY